MKNETARREIESLDYYLQNHTNDYSEKSHTAMMMAIEALKQEPIKHGEWILDGGTPICSACHEEPCWSSEGYDFTDFCPNCGAKMDKGGDTE